jgi:hypothetical protein
MACFVPDRDRDYFSRSVLGVEVGAEGFGGQHDFWGGKDAPRGKHRTEVAEVTEGIGVGPQKALGDSMTSGRERRASGKASHGGHGGQGGELALDRDMLWGTA